MDNRSFLLITHFDKQTLQRTFFKKLQQLKYEINVRLSIFLLSLQVDYGERNCIIKRCPLLKREVF
jgi:hypothetical protein